MAGLTVQLSQTSGVSQFENQWSPENEGTEQGKDQIEEAGPAQVQHGEAGLVLYM